MYSPRMFHSKESFSKDICIIYNPILRLLVTIDFLFSHFLRKGRNLQKRHRDNVQVYFSQFYAKSAVYQPLTHLKQ